MKVGLVDGRGGRRGGNLSKNEQNATFRTPWTALSAAALRSARNASRVRGTVNERPCMEDRTARRPPVNCMIGVCVRKDMKVGLVDGRGGRRGGN